MGDAIWVYGDGRMTRFDMTTRTFTDAVEVPALSNWPGWICCIASDDAIWLIEQEEGAPEPAYGRVWRLDTDTLEITDSLELGIQIRGGIAAGDAIVDRSQCSQHEMRPVPRWGPGIGPSRVSEEGATLAHATSDTPVAKSTPLDEDSAMRMDQRSAGPVAVPDPWPSPQTASKLTPLVTVGRPRASVSYGGRDEDGPAGRGQHHRVRGSR